MMCQEYIRCAQHGEGRNMGRPGEEHDVLLLSFKGLAPVAAWQGVPPSRRICPMKRYAEDYYSEHGNNVRITLYDQERTKISVRMH